MRILQKPISAQVPQLEILVFATNFLNYYIKVALAHPVHQPIQEMLFQLSLPPAMIWLSMQFVWRRVGQCSLPAMFIINFV
jgi:hypothetical protein